MEPQGQKPRLPSAVDRQLLAYRNPLPQVPREDNHSFFKETHLAENHNMLISMGYRVGVLGAADQTFFSQVINMINALCCVNLQVSLRGRELWVQTALSLSRLQFETNSFFPIQAHLHTALIRARDALLLLFEQRTAATTDHDILASVKNEIIPKIKEAFRNPDLDD